MTGDAPAPAVVVMGVSAVGKTTVASELAGLLGVPFVDADDLHPTTNVEKMRSGTPLADADRWPWLDRVGQTLADGQAEGGIVVACSALRRAYRDRLRAACPGTVFVHLEANREVLARRAAARAGHFMPPALLDSQLATLEPLEADEIGVAIGVEASLADIVAAAKAWIVAR